MLSSPASGRRYWTAARIEGDLRCFLDKWTPAEDHPWPCKSEFEAHGQAPLYHAACRYGGIAYWRQRLGFEPSVSFSRNRMNFWTDAELQARLTSFCSERTSWPTRLDFERAGELPLWWAMTRCGGVRAWAERMGYPPRTSPAHVEQELRNFLAPYSGWPPYREFVKCGKDRLYRRASELGGIAYWQSQLGLS